MTDAEKPVMGHNDLLIKIRKTAICGTDMHIYNWDEWAQNTIPVPMAVGQEYVGEVVVVGQVVKGTTVGVRVFGEAQITLGAFRKYLAGRVYVCLHTRGEGGNREGGFTE